MANKYLIHGATYCGDGTTSSEAASNGAAGAWNNINVFEGTAPAYGTLAGGDVVYIRSKASGGTAISVSKSAAQNLGVGSLSEASPITWVFDDGTVWSGVSDTVTYTMTNSNAFTLQNYNNLVCNNNLLVKNTLTNAGTAEWLKIYACSTKDLRLDTSANTTGNGAPVGLYTSGGTHTNLQYDVGNVYSTAAVFMCGTNADIVFINPSLNLTSTVNTGPLFTGMNYGGSLKILGGEAYGPGCVDGRYVFLVANNTGSFEAYGFKFPRNMTLANVTNKASVFATGVDGYSSSNYADYYYSFDSRSDGYYPTLNATLDTSDARGWSFRVYPNNVTKQKPACVGMMKLYTQSAAAKTITVNFLWPSASTPYTQPTSADTYIEVSYTDDTTGEKVFLSTYDIAGDAIDTSTAAWSATTYGALSLTKYEISVTTPTSIKQDTDIVVTLMTTVKASSATQMFFVDPDPVLT